MIESIQLINFQSHKNTKLDFTKDINVICGSHGKGKTSIIRALKLIFCQKPRGSSYIRRGSNSCKIIVTVNGKEIVFTRTKTTSKYEFDGQTFTALNNTVPEEVLSFVGFNDINLQEQFDNFFLINESGGKAASVINEITKLEKAEGVVKNLCSKHRSLKQDKEYSENKRNEIEQLIKSFSYIESLDNLLLNLEEKLNLKNKLENSKNSLVDKYNRYEQLLKQINDLHSINYDFSIIENKLKTYKSVNNTIDRINNLKFTYESVCDKISTIDFTKLLSNIDLFEYDVNEYNKSSNVINRINIQQNKYEDFMNKIALKQEEIELKQKEYDAIYETFEICPFCNREMK